MQVCIACESGYHEEFQTDHNCPCLCHGMPDSPRDEEPITPDDESED